MRLIPVVDVLNGVVVRAVGGRRGEYRPLRSRLVESVDPVKVARVLMARTGSPDVYVADLDAIVHGEPNTELLAELAAVVPGTLLCDVGLRTSADYDTRIPQSANVGPVIGSETVQDMEAAGPAQAWEGRAAFSVDTKDGELIGRWEAWRDVGVTHPRAVAEMARAGWTVTGAGVLILLDLARIGSAAGPDVDTVRTVRGVVPKDVRVYIGGGVRTPDDVKRAADAGADGALVASGLHDGTLPG